MKIQLYILIGILLMAVLISLGSYNTAESALAPHPPPPEDYNTYINSPYEVRPPFKIFGVHLIPEGTACEQLNALGEFQERPCLEPPCRCGRGGFGWRGFKGRLKCLPFIGAREAGKHQERLEAILERENTILGASIQ